MELEKRIIDALNSYGNLTYQLLYNYNIVNFKKSNVYVRTVSDKNGTRAEFGVYVRDYRRNEFSPIEDYSSYIESLISNKVIEGYDFSKDFITDDFIIEVNPAFRLINIVQVHFKDLLNKIYVQGVSGNLEIPSMTLVEQDKKVLFEYFENLVNRNYSLLFENRISRILHKSSTFMFFKSLEQFIPVFFSGPCVLNPILDCSKYSRLFKETKFYQELMKNRINIENNSVSILTNKEICECLGLDRFVPFENVFLTSIVLGVFNPSKFTSPSSYRYFSEDGKVYFEEDLVKYEIPRDKLSRVSSLYLAVKRYSKRLRISDVDLCVSILNNVTLV